MFNKLPAKDRTRMEVHMGAKKQEDTLETNPETEKDFVIVLEGVEVLPNTEKIVYAPLGIRSPGGVVGAKLETLVSGYERGAYMDTFLEIRKYILQHKTACLGMIKLSIASHIRWWLGNERIPSEGDKERMKSAFIEASKANTVTESYFTFASEIVKEIHGELPDEELIEKTKLYTGEDSPVVVSDDGYSGLYGNGWYPALSLKNLVRLPNTGKMFFPSLDLYCPQTDS